LKTTPTPPPRGDSFDRNRDSRWLAPVNATPRILEAYWESTTSGLIVLAEDWSGDDPPPLFFGPPKQSFASLEVAPRWSSVHSPATRA